MNRTDKLCRLLKSQRQILIGCLGFVLGFGLIWIASQNMKIIISETDSHSKHYFLHLPCSKAKLNDYVLVDSAWYGKKIIKQIVGLEGGRILYDSDQCLWINNKKIGLLKSKSKDNKKLTPIASQVISKGYVFVYSSHESSFDSRYKELGLIPVSALEGKVIPLI